MKRIAVACWNNKQAITGVVTTSVSSLALAGMITESVSVKITTVTGIITAVLGLVYTLWTSAEKT